MLFLIVSSISFTLQALFVLYYNINLLYLWDTNITVEYYQ